MLSKEKSLSVKGIDRILLLGADKYRGIEWVEPMGWGDWQNGKKFLEVYRSSTKNGIFGKFEDRVVGIPIDKIDPEIYMINGQTVQVVRWGFDQQSYDDKISLSNKATILNLRREINNLRKTGTFLLGVIDRIPSQIRKDEFTENTLERLRTYFAKFSPQKPEEEKPAIYVKEKEKK